MRALLLSTCNPVTCVSSDEQAIMDLHIDRLDGKCRICLSGMENPDLLQTAVQIHTIWKDIKCSVDSYSKVRCLSFSVIGKCLCCYGAYRRASLCLCLSLHVALTICCPICVLSVFFWVYKPFSDAHLLFISPAATFDIARYLSQLLPFMITECHEPRAHSI